MKKITSILILALGIGGTANATLLQGTFATRGTMTIGQGGANIDFAPPVNGSFGQVSVGTATGDFAAAVGQSGSQMDILSIAAGPINVLNFVTLNAYPTYTFTATNVNAGVFPSTCAGGGAGASCTPNGVFNFANLTANSTSLSFVITGTVTDGSGDPASEFLGVFLASYSNKSYSQVISEYTSGSIATSFSASFVVDPPAVVPEPGTMLLMGIALALAGSAGRRFHTKV